MSDTPEINNLNRNNSVAKEVDSLDHTTRFCRLQHIAIEEPTNLPESAVETLQEVENLCNKAISNAARHDKYLTHIKLDLIDSRLILYVQGVNRNSPHSVIERFVSANTIVDGK